MATTEPHAGQRSDAKATTAELPKSPSSEPPAWPSHDLIRRNGGPSVGERAGAVRPGPLPGADATDAAAIAAAIRAAEMEAAMADVTAAEIEAAEAAAAELAADDLTGEFDDPGSADATAETTLKPTAGAGTAKGSKTTSAAAAEGDDAREAASAAPAIVATTAPSEPAASGDVRRPTKFMADLTAAMRAAAEAARESAVVQLRTDAVAEVETIRSDSTVYSANRRERAEEDVAGIREWSKAEIARIRAETEEGIVARRHRLDEEMIEQAGRLDEAINRVEYTVAGYEQRMAQFFDRLLQEEDPSRFATMAGQLPEPPPFEPWSPEPPVALAVADTTALAVIAEEPATDETADASSAEDVEAQSAGTQSNDEVDATSTMVAVGPGEPASGKADSAVALIPDPSGAATDQAASDEGASGAPAGTGKAARAGAGAHEVTQVIVVGLVSVASIATFKRMIARTPGVKSVHVSSGPQGEFVFGVTHDPSVDVMATVMSMEGFSPTVVAVSPGEISVAARDPEQAA